MSSSRLLAASAIIAAAIILGFALSIPHARDGGNKLISATTASSTPFVTFRDSYRRGVHTITGTVLAPNPCTLVSATATPVLNGTSTAGITLALTMPTDQGVCLQVPSTVNFSTQINAPAGVPIRATVNGSAAHSSTSTNP